jgi:hypothetical protein
VTVDIASRYRALRTSGVGRRQALLTLGQETHLDPDGVKVALRESAGRERERSERRRERRERLAARRGARKARAS